MKKMELQECSMQTNSTTAVGRRYVKALLPILRRIHGLQQPAASRRIAALTTSQKAKLVRVAADLCLVKAAGGNAKWGKALYRTLSRQKELRCALQKCAMETADVEADGDGRCLAAGLDSDSGAQRTFSLQAKEKIRRCKRYPHRRRQKRSCRSIDVRDGYFIAGDLWDRYRGAHWCRGISNLSSHECTISMHQPQHEYSCCGRRTCQTLRPLRTKSWFKKCRKPCTTLAHLHTANQNVTAKSRRILAGPTISAAATSIESHNEDYTSKKVHDMAGQIGALRKLIPGGDLLTDSASLLEETALYILALQMQVHSLSALATNISAPTHTHTILP